jgi:hypothetical protein
MRCGKQTLGITELSNAKEDADVDVYAEVGKVTFKINGDEALSDESV